MNQLALRISRHLSEVIHRTALVSAPFEFVTLDGVFPDEVYSEMLRQLPENSYYRQLKHSDAILANGQSARLQFPLQRANITRLPDSQRAFWDEVTEGVSSSEVQEAWRSKFRITLEQVSHKPIANIKFRPEVTLFRDLRGYKISIHPDSPRKAVTTQYYLPSDDSQVHLGTIFHGRDADGAYNEARTMRFVPNSGYAFAVSPVSYHSVKPMKDGDKPRNSLMVMWKYDRGPLVEGFKSSRTQVRAWYDRLRRRSPAEVGESRYE